MAFEDDPLRQRWADEFQKDVVADVQSELLCLHLGSTGNRKETLRPCRGMLRLSAGIGRHKCDF